MDWNVRWRTVVEGTAPRGAIGSLPGQISSIEARMRADRPDYSQLVTQRTVLVRQLNSAERAGSDYQNRYLKWKRSFLNSFTGCAREADSSARATRLFERTFLLRKVS